MERLAATALRPPAKENFATTAPRLKTLARTIRYRPRPGPFPASDGHFPRILADLGSVNVAILPTL